MNLAADILKQREADLNQPVLQDAPIKTMKTVVPLDEARRRVTSSTFGEITRRKTEDKNMVEILSGTTVIGTAIAVYKTKTQRTWTVTIGEVVLENQHTISKALRAFDAAPTKAKVLAGPTPAKKAAKTVKVKANG